MSQTGVSILGGFQAVKSERKVRFGQTWWQSKGLMEYYHIKLFKRQSRPFIKPQNPKSSKISDITFKLLFMTSQSGHSVISGVTPVQVAPAIFG